jgi:isopentenyl-diphosphate delta-isomerase type 1
VQRPDEIFDVVDESDRVIGRALRAEVHARKLRHRAVHIFLFNERGELFVQKRSASKDSFPGRHDSSASGHLSSGEDYGACAIRELREELGLAVPSSRLQRHFKIEACEQTGWEFVWAYSLQTNEQPRINPDEIESGAFWPLTQLHARLAAHPGEFAPSFARVFAEFERCKLLAEGDGGQR